MSDKARSDYVKKANALLEKKGAKSRYIDDAPETDFTLEGDEQAADREDTGTMDDIPEHLQRKAERAERQVAAELAARSRPQVKRLSRAENLERMIRGVKAMIGSPYEHHLDEYLSLTGERHAEDTRED